MNNWNELFTQTYAENAPSLPEHLFVVPTHLNWEKLLKSPSSTIIFGETGTGKTTLARHFEISNPDELVLRWLPQISQDVEHLRGSDLSWWGFHQVLQLLSIEMIPFLSQHIEQLNTLPDWVLDGIAWLWDQYCPEQPVYAINSRTAMLPSSVTATLLEIALRKYNPPIRDETNYAQILSTVDVLMKYGLKITRVLITIDLKEQDCSDEFIQLLNQMLDTLKPFEQPTIKFILLAPTMIQARLISTSGITRDRLSVEHLTWSMESLWQIIEKRYHEATDNTLPSRELICESPLFAAWLKELEIKSNLNPRTWLTIWQPVLQCYYEKNFGNKKKPLRHEEWLGLMQEIVPSIKLDKTEQIVQIGQKQIRLSHQNFLFFAYLFEHAPDIISHEDLYYKALRGFDSIPATQAKDWEPIKTWRSTTDSVLNRLRKQIEPDPAHPIYIITIRGQGVSLKHKF